MIKLNTVLPGNIIKETAAVTKVQQQLVNLTKSQFKSVLASIQELPFADDVAHILELILIAAEARVLNLEVYAEFTAFLSDSSDDYSMIKGEIFRLFYPEKVKYYYFLKYVQLCVSQGYISDDEIAYAVENFRSDYPNEVIPTAYLFYYFAPFLQTCNKQLYDDLYKTYQKSASRFGVFHEIQNFIPRVPKLSANNWDLYWKEMEVGYPSDSLESIIKNDDVQTLQDRSQNERNFDINQEIKLHSYECSAIPESNATLVQFAAYYGSMKCFRFLMKNADISVSKSPDFPTECFAIAGGNSEVIDSFIKRRCGFKDALKTVVSCHRYELFDTIYAKNKDKVAFHYAAASSNLSALIFFIEHGSDVNQVAPNDNEDIIETPLHFAAKFGRSDSTRLLLSHKKIDVNIGAGLRTPLHIAAAKGFAEVVDLLITMSKSLDVNALTGANRTALQDAAHFGHLRVVQSLLGVKGIELNGDVPTPIQEAVKNGFAQVAMAILEKQGVELGVIDDDENTLLHLAALSGNAEIVEDLLSSKSPKIKKQLTAENRYQQTPLAVASENTLSDCVSAFIRCGGSDPNARDVNGNTPLHLAAKQGSFKSVKMILELPNVSINEQNNDSVFNNFYFFYQTPLHLAAKRCRQMMLKTLLSYKDIDVNAQDEMGRTPLHRMVEGKPMDGVEVMLSAKGLDFNAQDSNGETPLHLAAKCNYPEYINYLLAHKEVDVNAVDNNGQTALHKAAGSPNYDSIKFLLGKGIDINAQDVHGVTALHIATKAKESVIVQAILKQPGVEVNLLDENKQSPLHWAAKNGNFNIIKAILASGGNMNAKDKTGVLFFYILFINCQLIFFQRKINLEMKNCSVQDHQFHAVVSNLIYRNKYFSVLFLISKKKNGSFFISFLFFLQIKKT